MWCRWCAAAVQRQLHVPAFSHAHGRLKSRNQVTKLRKQQPNEGRLRLATHAPMTQAPSPPAHVISTSLLFESRQLRERRESRKLLERGFLSDLPGLTAGDCAEWIPNSARNSCLHCERWVYLHACSLDVDHDVADAEHVSKAGLAKMKKKSLPYLLWWCRCCPYFQRLLLDVVDGGVFALITSAALVVAAHFLLSCRRYQRGQCHLNRWTHATRPPPPSAHA